MWPFASKILQLLIILHYDAIPHIAVYFQAQKQHSAVCSYAVNDTNQLWNGFCYIPQQTVFKEPVVSLVSEVLPRVCRSRSIMYLQHSWGWCKTLGAPYCCQNGRNSKVLQLVVGFLTRYKNHGIWMTWDGDSCMLGSWALVLSMSYYPTKHCKNEQLLWCFSFFQAYEFPETCQLTDVPSLSSPRLLLPVYTTLLEVCILSPLHFFYMGYVPACRSVTVWEREAPWSYFQHLTP